MIVIDLCGTILNQYLIVKKGFEHTSNQQSLIRRFNSLANGSYKYNPFVINQIHQLNDSDGAISDRDIYNIFRKETFSGNQYLNSLQQKSNYFRFQYFNPLDSKAYYQNLDEQVLALITGDIGSMPELKKPEDKEDKNTSAFKNHSDDKVNTSNQHKESYQKDTKMNRTIIALSSSIISIFIGVIIAFIFKRRKEDEEV
ncbi:SdrH family protein [Staphylococcus pasteuri]